MKNTLTCGMAKAEAGAGATAYLDVQEGTTTAATGGDGEWRWWWLEEKRDAAGPGDLYTHARGEGKFGLRQIR